MIGRRRGITNRQGDFVESESWRRVLAQPDPNLPEPNLFVGREAEIGRLAARAEAARLGSPSFVLIEGPAGIGKTALARQAREMAEGFRVLSATGAEDETGLAYGVVDQLLAGLAPGRALSRDHRARPDEQWAAGSALVDLFGTLGAEQPLAVFVDDVHWADGPSLSALAFALRRLRADPVLGVLVGRSGAPLPAGLVRLAGGETGERMELTGLDARELAELAHGLGLRDLPRRTFERLADHTRGSPLHARALLEELSPDDLRSGGPLPAPRAYSSLVLSRLAALAAPARDLVVAAACLGPRCPLGLAARVAGVDDPGAAVDAAVEAGLLSARSRAAGWELAFSHPLVRAAVYEDLGPARRTSLHGRAADLTTGAARLDHRVAAALVEDADLATELEAAATGEAAEGAVGAAAEHMLSAARLSPAAAVGERRLVEAVRLLVLAGNASEASAYAAELARLPASSRRDLVLGHLALLTGRLSDAEALLEASWAGGSHGAEAAHTAAQLAQLMLIQGRGTEAAQWARRAAQAHPEASARVAAVSRLMTGLANSGRAEEALGLVEGFDPPSGTAGLSPADVDRLLGRGVVRLWTDHLEGARDDLLAAVTQVNRWGHLKEAAIFLTHLADAEYRLGLWDDALAHADQAASLAEDSDQAWLLGGTHSMVVFPAAGRGLWELAGAHARRAVEAAAALPETEEANRGYAASAAAHLAWAQGDPTGVVEAVKPILSFRNRAGSYEPGTMPWRELYAEALVTLGRLDEADAVLTPYEELAAERGRRSSQAAASRARGALELARGRPELARQAFALAVEHAAAVPAPFDEALARYCYGRFLRRAGERRAAFAELSGARQTFLAVQAVPFLERADRELAGTGLAPSPRRGPYPSRPPLTPQELAVARLAAAGRTNKEVAAELVVSVKTVEYHLANVFAKLGIRSRRQLVAHVG